jgi:uncharacterized protein (TIGR02996 family)
MRYETTQYGYVLWRRGREVWTPTRTAAFTLTRRGTMLAMRLVRRGKKIRWTQSHDSVAAAERARLRIHNAILGSGFKFLDGEDIKLPEPDPLKAWRDACIGAEGDDARLVYADLLTERCDARGELIVAQARAEGSYDDLSKLTVADRLMKQQHVAFLGPLADRAERGHVHWRRGFVDSLILERDYEAERDDDFDIEGLLVAGLTHPSGALVRELTLGLDPVADEVPRKPMREVVALLCALAPPALEVLTLRSARYQGASIGDITPIFESLPRLTTMTVEAREITFSALDAPMLEELTLDGPLSEMALEALTMTPVSCPRLERLAITSSTSIPPAIMSDLRRTFGSRLSLQPY